MGERKPLLQLQPVSKTFSFWNKTTEFFEAFGGPHFNVKSIILCCAGLALCVALIILVSSNGKDAITATAKGEIPNRSLKITFAASGTESADGSDGEETTAIVRISRQGRVQGTVLKSRQNRNYFAFLNVPYAQPPVGNLRFAFQQKWTNGYGPFGFFMEVFSPLPKEPKRWRGVRDGTKIGSECLQQYKYAPTPNVTSGSEDCLYLNIYTPKLPKSSNQVESVELPVLVYFHGGGPHGNGTRYGAKYFMDEDCILITLNFRLGMLGSFTTGTREFPGHLSSRDQILALKWIQKNIQRFGGDPKKVLIFGNSSGASFVHAHLLSTMSKGLFSRAVMQSGTSIPQNQAIKDPMKIMQEFMTEVGCGGGASQDGDGDSNFSMSLPDKNTITCLRELNGDVIALSSGPASTAVFFSSEKQEDDITNKFLPALPWELMREGSFANHVPLIVGVNSKEIKFDLMSFGEGGTQYLNDQFDKILPSLVGIPDDAQHTVAKKFREAYFGTEKISNETRFQLWDLMSDATVHASRVAGMSHANVTRDPVFFYRLSKEPPRSYQEYIKKVYPPPYGVAHADELQFLFLYEGYPEILVDSPWFEFSKKMVHMWVSFARDGRPDESYTNLLDVEWGPILLEDNGMKWMELDDKNKYVQPFTQRMELWDEYIDELYGNFE